MVRQKARPTIGACGVISLGYGAREVILRRVMMLRQCAVELATANYGARWFRMSMLLTEYERIPGREQSAMDAA